MLNNKPINKLHTKHNPTKIHQPKKIQNKAIYTIKLL